MTLSLILDIIVSIVIIGFTILGCVKGFIKTFFKVFGTIFSIIFAVLLASTVASFLEESFSLTSSIAGSIKGTLVKSFGDSFMNTPLSTINDANFQSLNKDNVPLWLLSKILNLKNNPAINQSKTISDIVCPLFAHYISVAISFVILFIIFKLMFFIMSIMITKYMESKNKKLKLIKKTDKTLGGVIGFFRGVAIIQIVIIVISAIPLSFCQSIITAINSATITSVVNKINIITLVFNAISVPVGLFL